MRRFRRLLKCTFLLVLALTAMPVQGRSESVPPGLKRAVEVQQRHTETLLRVSGVVGTAVGLAEGGVPVVKIFAERAGISGLPAHLDGIPVMVQVTGPLHAVGSGSGVLVSDPAGSPAAGQGKSGAPDPTERFERPVPIGVSTGNWNECSAGTIAARVTSGGNVYALSNNHVYARENKATIGEEILQPGRYDTNCSRDPADVIGTLASFAPIVFSTAANNLVDAAMALSAPEKLGTATPSNGYGLPKARQANEPLSVVALLGQPVQKYGRTTALTKGAITAIFATVNVIYGEGTARFVDQLIMECRKPCLKAGDSGSLVVTDSGRVSAGVLYAGNSSGKFAIANRIDHVLTNLAVDLEGE